MSYLRTQAFQGRSQRIQADMEPVGGDLSLVRAERPAVGGTIQYIVRDSSLSDLGRFRAKSVVKSVAAAVQKPVVKIASVMAAPVLAPAVLAKDALKVGTTVGKVGETIGKTVGAMTGLYKPKQPQVNSTGYKGFTVQWVENNGPYYITAAPDPSATPMFADLNQPDAGYATFATLQADVDRVIAPPAGWMPPLSYRGFKVECDPAASPMNFLVTALPSGFALPSGSTFTGGPYPDQAAAKAEIDKVLTARAAQPTTGDTGQTGASTTTTVATSDGSAPQPAAQTATYKGFTFTAYPSGGSTAWYITANAGQVQLTGPLKNGPYASQSEAQTAVDLATRAAAPAAASNYPAAQTAAPAAASNYPAFSPSMPSGGAYGGSSAADYSFESGGYGAESSEASYGDDAAASDYGDTEGAPMDDSGATSDEDATYTDEQEGTNGLSGVSGGGGALATLAVVGVGLWLLTRKRRG